MGNCCAGAPDHGGGSKNGGGGGRNDAVDLFLINYLSAQVEFVKFDNLFKWFSSWRAILNLWILCCHCTLLRTCEIEMCSPRDGSLEEIGRTEGVLNSLDPVWIAKFIVDYQFEVVQPLVFQLYDIDSQFHGISVEVERIQGIMSAYMSVPSGMYY